MDDCVFCRIVSGEEPAQIHSQDDWCILITPLNPATDGHRLVISKRHYEDFLQLLWGETLEISRSVSRWAMQTYAVLRPDGMNLITSAGEAASQTVMHLHWHIVPRYNGDRLGDIWAGAR